MVEELFHPRRDEEAIPVLTEIIDENAPAPRLAVPTPRYAPPVVERDIGAPLTPVMVPASALPANPQVETAPDDMQLAAIETQLRETVLQRVLTRLEPVLEHRLNETTREVLEQIVPALRNELQQALTDTVQDIISRAIAQEFAKISAQKK